MINTLNSPLSPWVLMQWDRLNTMYWDDLIDAIVKVSKPTHTLYDEETFWEWLVHAVEVGHNLAMHARFEDQARESRDRRNGHG